MSRKSNIALLTAMMVAVTSCGKITRDPASEIERIHYAASTPATKVMAPSDFLMSGNEMRVYDLFSTTVNSQTKKIAYINGATVKSPNGTGIWSYNEGDGDYYWLKGTHQFFGFSTKEKTEGGFTATYDEIFNEPSVNIKEKKATFTLKAPLTYNSKQFDLVYSKLVERTITGSDDDDVSPVNLICAHAFAAFGITVENNLDEKVTIRHLYIQNLKNNQSAEISFNNTEEYTLNLTGTNPVNGRFADIQGTIDIPGKTIVSDVFNTSSEEPGYYIVWPQDDLTPTVAPSISNDGEAQFNENDPLIVVEYRLGEYEEDEAEEGWITRAVPFPNIDSDSERPCMLAGSKYNYVLLFTEKMISVEVIVSDWEKTTENIDYKDRTVSLMMPEDEHMLLPVVGTYIESEDKAHTLLFDPDKEQIIKMTFQLATPTSGVWIASMVGNFNAFEFTGPSASTDKRTASGSTSSEAMLQIKPKDGLPAGTYEIKLKFAVQLPDGTITDADSTIQPDSDSRNNPMPWKYIIRKTID